MFTIHFLHSSSLNFPLALREARLQPFFRQDGKTYSVSYAKGESAKLHKLLDYLKGLRNRRVFVDGKELPWHEIFHYIYCYELRQKAYDPAEYCHGDARQYPALNPWGCIQTIMPLSNDTEWLHYGRFDKDDTWLFDKEKIAHYLKANTYRFRFCPALDMNMMTRILEAFPETANPKIDKNWAYAEIFDRHLVANLSLFPKPEQDKHYCGVRPASPKAATNIYKKILAKLR